MHHVKPEGGKLNLYIKNKNDGLLTDLLGGSPLLTYINYS